LAWHPSGDRIAVGCRDRKIRLMTEDGRAGAILSGPVVRTVEWSPNGERLASGGDALLRLWNGQVIPLSASKEHAKNIVALAWSPDGKFVATVSEDGTARVWSADGKVEQVINLSAPARRVVWSPDSQQIATATDKQVQIWNRDGTPGPELADSPTGLVALAWNTSKDQIAAGGWSRDFQLWDGEGAKGSTQKQAQAIMDIAFHPQGDQVAMALFDNKAVVTKADGSQGRVWEAHAGPVNAVAWHPDGRAIVTGGYDNTLRFWDAKSLSPKRTVLFFHDGGSATLTAAGQIEQGDLSSLEDDLLYLVETEAGERKQFTPADFEKQFHETKIAGVQQGV
jgi:WD40 repeat protein